MTNEGMEQYMKQARQAIVLSVGVALLLTVVKFSAGLMTHSMAIMASALDSTLDMLMSALNFFAFREASKPPDVEHAYGHGKVESLAGLFQSLFIILSGSFVVYESIRRLLQGSFVDEIPLGIGVIVFSGIVTLLLSWRLKVLSKKNRSLILGTEKVHYSMDFVSYVGVIAALLLVGWTGKATWDLIVSILVAVYIFKEAIRILIRAVSELLDRGLSSTELKTIKMLILRHHPSIIGAHNLRSRVVGNQLFLDFHIEIRGEDNFKKAHDMTESLIDKIRDHHPNADVTVHFDPEGE
ncbi:MAG: cation diffusion facilitator family transporter [Candidatus Omnitrophota bacterium]|jgi:cation diffusion facilitator family transporter